MNNLPDSLKKHGIIALVGETNSGKSTLMNALVDDKVSIVSHKVQTTRNRILGISNEGLNQLIFIDTPGLFAPRTNKDSFMLKFAYGSLVEATTVVVMIDGQKGLTPVFQKLMQRLALLKHPNVILVINKIDLLKAAKDKLLNLAAELYATKVFKEVFMISALQKASLTDLKNYLTSKVEYEGWLFDEDISSNVSQQFWATEITREKIYRFVHQEIPYALVVKPMLWDEGAKDVIIKQDIVVNKPSHKKILVGHKGATIRRISLASKEELASSMGKKVHLYLFVKVNGKAITKEQYFHNLDCINPKD